MKTLIIEIPEPGDERGMFDVVDHEGRRWPDWRTADRSKAIEHDRSGEPA